MGPHGGLNLRGGTGCPAPHWNDGTNAPRPIERESRGEVTPGPATFGGPTCGVWNIES